MNEAFDLDAITYIPAIRSRQAELRGYRELRADIKANLRPVVSLGKLGRIADPARVAERVIENVGGPFFLDLNTYAEQQCDGWQQLASADENFGAWRAFAKTVERAVPVVLLREASERALIRQMLAIESDHGVVVLRSRRPAADLPLLQAAIAVVEDVNNMLVILDLGYIRASMEIKEVEASRVINALRTTEPSVRIAVMSSSFPRSVSAYGEQAGSLEILERVLHARLGGSEVAIYADHAAIHPDPFVASASRWVPRIDYATPDTWTFRRHRADDGGFPRCARELVQSADWEDEFAANNWGAARILEQSRAADTLPGFGSPAPWISVRVNMHIDRQATQPPSDEYEDEEDGEG